MVEPVSNPPVSTPPEGGNTPPGPNIEGMGIDYCAGILSSRAIGARYGVSHTFVNKKAKELGWVKDLEAAIRAKADDKVHKAEAAAAGAKATHAAVINASSQLQADIRLAHRKLVDKALQITAGLFKELEEQSGADKRALEDLLKADITLEGKPLTKAQRDRITSAIRRGQDLNGRSAVNLNLSNALKVQVLLERQAFGIADKDPEDKPQVARVVKVPAKEAEA